MGHGWCNCDFSPVMMFPRHFLYLRRTVFRFRCSAWNHAESRECWRCIEGIVERLQNENDRRRGKASGAFLRVPNLPQSTSTGACCPRCAYTEGRKMRTRLGSDMNHNTEIPDWRIPRGTDVSGRYETPDGKWDIGYPLRRVLNTLLQS
jgi:hypothetical protein